MKRSLLAFMAIILPAVTIAQCYQSEDRYGTRRSCVDIAEAKAYDYENKRLKIPFTETFVARNNRLGGEFDQTSGGYILLDCRNHLATLPSSKQGDDQWISFQDAKLINLCNNTFRVEHSTPRTRKK